MKYVACPRCAAQVAWSKDSPFKPFCSERCKMSDLGAWATEEYRVPAASKDPAESGEERGEAG